MALNKYYFGDFIKQRREKYDVAENLPSWGVSKEGFIRPKQDGADTSIYNVFYKNDFVFNPARMELNSIALNTNIDKAICSSLYEVFFVSRPDIVLPEYLNLFIKRDEFARKCWFEAIGSARNYFRVANLSEFEIELPSISIQQKYVDVYKAMLANQQCYDRGLEDLQIVLESYLDDLKNNTIHKSIGSYIEICDDRNEKQSYGLDDVRGISIEKKLIETKADMMGVNLKPYYLVRPKDFVYVTVTSRNGGKISLAMNDTENTYICSSSYVVFRCKDENVLYPQYLMLYFFRSEFNRYARFNSWGSARETFDWNEMCDVKIPLPDITTQKSIANIYCSYIERKSKAEKLKKLINEICPILVKGSIEEARKAV